MECTIGEIRLFAGNFEPRSWKFCKGQLLSISGYEALFSVIGNHYGGDGRSNFALPDLRGRVPVNPGNGAMGLEEIHYAQSGGTQQLTLTELQLPSHTHTPTETSTLSVEIQTSSQNGDTPVPGDNYLARSVYPKSRSEILDVNLYSDSQDGKTIGGVNIQGTVTVQLANTGGGQPHENRMPFLGLNYIICIDGQYPTRS